mmetsp:Transcript_21663/g.26688  ORF Transcript_21663/g.26688 Transcript_21663/m.26688 type:complete len:140 (+) Transcript_21663:69-488(+)
MSVNKENTGNNKVIKITSYDDFEKIKSDAESNNQLMIADINASWCKPCKTMKPIFYDLAGKYGDIIFLDIDIDENDELCDDLEVKKLPTFLFFKNNDEQKMELRKNDTLIGNCQDKLTKYVADHFKSKAVNEFCLDADF